LKNILAAKVGQETACYSQKIIGGDRVLGGMTRRPTSRKGKRKRRGR